MKKRKAAMLAALQIRSAPPGHPPLEMAADGRRGVLGGEGPSVVIKWFYAHAGRTEGPFSTAELQERAQAGLLHPDDPLWPEGADPQGAIEAYTIVDCPVPPPPPPAPPALPDWLDDVRAADQPVYPPAPPVDAPLPDWLADVRQAEGEGAGPAAPPAPPSKSAEEAAAEILLSEPPDGSESQRGWTPPKSPAAAGGTGPVPLASPVSGPAAGGAGPGQHGPPRTQPPPARPTEPFDVAFRRAMKEVHHWVDQEANQPLILRGSLDAIRRDAGFQELLQRYQGYGPEMVHKLWQYLHFLIENRR
jgi:hypothetical protein